MNCIGYVGSRQDTNRNNTKCMLSVQYHYNKTPVTPCTAEHFLKCLLTALLCLYSRSHKPQETVCILNVLNVEVSIHMLYRNALDIHCKHMVSQLHVAEHVLQDAYGSQFRLANVMREPLCDFSRCRLSCLDSLNAMSHT